MSFSEFRKSEEFQRLSNTVPEGSFGISEAGRQQAAINKGDQYPEGAFAISQEGRDQAAINRGIWAAEQTGIPSGEELKAGSFSISDEGKRQAAANIEEFNKNKEKSTSTSTPIQYRDPLRKIAGGRVLQYPIDLDTDIQDYFEIQVFKYRPAGSLPRIDSSNQGSNPAGAFQPSGSYSSGSNRRGNRQNFRLQDLQSTIQLPMPPSIKDNNSVDFAGGSMSGFAAQIFGPAVNKFLSGEAVPDKGDENLLQSLRSRASGILLGTVDLAKETLGAGFGALRNKEFRRVTQLNAIAQAVAALGVNIDVNQAITRTSGAVRNPNLELLFKGPALRNFSFTIRLTPRDSAEAKRIRMIIRVLKQHSAVKRNANVFGDAETSNFLIGTPDVFKLRYIKARTQRDIKGLNKFKTCALTSISVDYTGEVGRFAAYEEDSQPVTTIISLAFTELTPLYDEDYAEFTSDDDVGL